MKTYGKKIFILLILFAGMSTASRAITIDVSGKGKISGKILDAPSKSPMEYVSAVLYSLKDSSLLMGTISQKDGTFSLSGLQPGKYFMEFSFIGYKKHKVTPLEIDSKSNDLVLGELAMSPVLEEINEVLVTGTRSNVEYKTDKKVVNVDKEILAKGGSAIQALENTPSVQVDGQGNLTLRGSSDYKVLIDGKPSILKGSEALKQIPANAIKQIEVITNPSAKYEADGQAGIINVILKNEMLQGLNGSVSLGVGSTEKSNASATVNFRKKRLNLFTGIDFGDNTYREVIDLNTLSFLPGNTVEVSGKVKTFSNNQNLGVRAGFDLDFNEKNSLSLSGSYSRQGYDNGTTSSGITRFSSQASTYQTNGKLAVDIWGDVFRLNLDYTHSFSDKKKLTIANSLSTWSGADDNTFNEYHNGTGNGKDELYMMHNFVKDNSNLTYRLNIDFNSPLWGGEWESGVQFRMEPRKEDLIYQQFDTQTETWQRNITYSYELDYLNTISSGYVSYGNKLWGINYKFGGRAESFIRSMDLSNLNKPLEYNKFMLYPTLHLSKNISEKHTLQAGYSRRINRPMPYVLNNTPKYLDPRNVFRGNVNLIPEFTDAIELNFRTALKKASFSVQTYFRNTTNSFTTLRNQDENGIMHHTLANAKSQQAYGAELGADFKPFTWWQINANANLYHYTLTTEISQTVKVQEVNTWDGRLVNNFSFKWGTRIQASVYYRAPGKDAMGEVSGFYILNAAISQPICKGKGNISLSGQNLNRYNYTFTTKTEKFDNNYDIKVTGPTVMLNFTWSFNNFKDKQRGRQDDAQFKGGGGF